MQTQPSDVSLAVEMRGITKAFGTKVVANQNVDFELRRGEILESNVRTRLGGQGLR